ncbi:TAXI family TRAP transporter solute-binding subunit [Nitratireductor sp. GCM10026969]|uniref:TAXI family TRAP transporter solute-binding subunit n=1 Tax=Nitratireductor sp. GCM10026969 TaxID=3252645 RepID=UPI00361C35CB
MIKRFAAAALFIGVLGVFTTASAQTVRFGAGQQGSQNYGVNAALAQAIDERTELAATLQAFGGPTSYLPMLGSGELDMAAVVTPDFGDAVRGTGPFSEMPQKSLRVVVPLFPSPVGLMVRADSEIGSIADLEGKRVAWGMPAQASLQPYLEGALANGGLTGDDVRAVPVASVANGVAALVSGNVDATLFALRGGAVVEADAALGGIRWLPFDNSPEAVERMQAVAPEAYLVTVEGDAGVTGIPETMDTMAYDYVLVARGDLADETVAAVTKLLVEEGAAIATKNNVLGAMDRETIQRPYPDLTFHPAAEAVLRGE